MRFNPGGCAVALSLILAACLAGAPAFADVDVAGVRVPEKLAEGSQALTLNGAGLRTRFVVKVYVAALYVTDKTHDARAIIDSIEPRRIRLQMLCDVDSKSLDGALQDGLRDNTPSQELAALKAPAERLSRLMNDIGAAREGDVIDLDFNAHGVAIASNGKPRGRIDDPAFARALLRVWLGDSPAQSSLKKSLLGN